MKYYIWTSGCQMNQADSRHLARELELMGCRKADGIEEAGVIALNTCVVRQHAEERALGRLSSLKPLKERRPEVILGVMGCLVGDADHLGERFPYVDVFCPPGRPEALLDLVRRRLGGRGAAQEETPHAAVCELVNIIYGCDNFCTYCIVPYRRGREASRPIPEVVEEVRGLVKAGAREVMLLGQNVDSYGHDLPGRPSLAQLLRELAPIPELWRLRFLTNHPKDMSDELIQTVASLEKVCEHLEVPVQSGNDEVLGRMGRGYTTQEYRGLIRRIREAIPNITLATDVIVGFPGESEGQFQATYELLAELRFDMVHVAAYSPRPGTAAARLPDDVPLAEKLRRRQAIEDLQEHIAGEINRNLLGKTLEVLVEGKERGKWMGRTRTNKLVFFADSADWRGKLALVRIAYASPWSMQGEVKGSSQ